MECIKCNEKDVETKDSRQKRTLSFKSHKLLILQQLQCHKEDAGPFCSALNKT